MSEGYLEGQLLIAMPSIGDPRFEKTVIFLCAHSADGAMGLIINKLDEHVAFDELMEQLEIKVGKPKEQIRVHIGGPVETGRGFVLHTSDYQQDGTMTVGPKFALTATVDILKSIATSEGPERSLLALGYAGWGAGQLDTEIQANGWLSCDADTDLLFDDTLDDKWERAIGKLGIDPSFLASTAGRA